tara:strand:- start:982 stop:1266 length:285 start_codon:yes stop_codon:yes gene_type:complete
MKNTLGRYEYRTSNLYGGSDKYGACELTGGKSGDMVMIARTRYYHRPDGTTGKAHVSNIYCTQSAANKYLREAPTGDSIQSAFCDDPRVKNLSV